MNFEKLSAIVGIKSPVDMTDDELREHIRELRKSRMTSKGPVNLSTPKEPRERKSKTKVTELTQAQKLELLKMLEED
jgi:hypothetical protein